MQCQKLRYLSQCCGFWTLDNNNEIVTICDDQVLVCPALMCLHLHLVCMWVGYQNVFHGTETASRGLKKISVRTVNTVVLVLSISVVKQLGVDELGSDFVVRKNHRYLAAHLLAQAISSMKSKCLLISHSPTAFCQLC